MRVIDDRGIVFFNRLLRLLLLRLLRLVVECERREIESFRFSSRMFGGMTCLSLNGVRFLCVGASLQVHEQNGREDVRYRRRPPHRS